MPKVEIIYATLAQQRIVELIVADSASIRDCIEQSGILHQHPEIELDSVKAGIFSQIKPLDHKVVEGDRVEIYRPLIADPKAARRKKAEDAKIKKP